jgi:hypothetical protein
MTEKFENWAIVELFGHTKVAGKVSEQSIGGCSFVRVDIPDTPAGPACTRLYGNGAIYGIIITDEKTARAAAGYFTPAPLDRWSIDSMLKKQLPAGEQEDIPFSDD